MEMMSYQPQRGLPEHREAGAFWLSREGFEVSAEQMAVTAGAHHGVLVALAAVTRPGEHIVSDSLTYLGVRSPARMLGRRLDGLEIGRATVCTQVTNVQHVCPCQLA